MFLQQCIKKNSGLMQKKEIIAIKENNLDYIKPQVAKAILGG